MTAAPTIDADFTDKKDEPKAEPETSLARADGGGVLLANSQYQAIRAISQEVARSSAFGLKGPEEKRRADAFVIITTGVEMGISPFQALRQIDVIDGRPSPKTDLMVALVRRNPDCEYFEAVEVTNTKATYRTKRKGRPEQVRSFTIEDAKRAQLTGKTNWKKYPADMLRARAASKLARQVFPESTGGLYIPEELEHLGDAEVVAEPYGEPEAVEATLEERQYNEASSKQAILAAIEDRLGLAGDSAKEHAKKVWAEHGLEAPVAESDLDRAIASIQSASEGDVDAPPSEEDDERQRRYRHIFAKLGETGRDKDEREDARHCYLAAQYGVESMNDLTDEQVDMLAEVVTSKTEQELDAWVAEWAEIARQAAKDEDE